MCMLHIIITGVEAANCETPGEGISGKLSDLIVNMVCATSKTSDKPAHMRSLIRVFASR